MFQLQSVLPSAVQCPQCRCEHWPPDRHVAGRFTAAIAGQDEGVVFEPTRELARGGFGVVLAAVWHSPVGERDAVVKVSLTKPEDMRGEVEIYQRLDLVERDDAKWIDFVRRRGLKYLPLPLLFSSEELDGTIVLAISLAGPSLPKLKRAQQKAGRAFSGLAVRQALTGVASALEYLTERSVVHRDMKPENVCIGPPGHTGHVMLVDLGEVGEGGAFPDEIDPTVFGGTRRYAATAQLRGQLNSSLMDLESLFYTLVDCAGHVPWEPIDDATMKSGMYDMTSRDHYFPWDRWHAQPLATVEAAVQNFLVDSEIVCPKALQLLALFGTWVFSIPERGSRTTDSSENAFRGEKIMAYNSDTTGEYGSVEAFYQDFRTRVLGRKLVDPDLPFDESGVAIKGRATYQLEQPLAPNEFTLAMAIQRADWPTAVTIARSLSRFNPVAAARMADHAPETQWQAVAGLVDLTSYEVWGHVASPSGLLRLFQKSNVVPLLAYLILGIRRPELLTTLRELVEPDWTRALQTTLYRRWGTFPLDEQMHKRLQQDGVDPESVKTGEQERYSSFGAWGPPKFLDQVHYYEIQRRYGEWLAVYEIDTIDVFVGTCRVLEAYGRSPTELPIDALKDIGVLPLNRDLIQMTQSKLLDEFAHYYRQIRAQLRNRGGRAHLSRVLKAQEDRARHPPVTLHFIG